MEGLIFGILQYLVYVIKLLLLHKFAFPVSTILLMVMTMMKTVSSLFFFRFSEGDCMRSLDMRNKGGLSRL